MKNYFSNDKEMYFSFPLDGDCLNEYDGRVTDDGNLVITARVKAPEGRNILINEIEAEKVGDFYETDVRKNRAGTVEGYVDRKTDLYFGRIRSFHGRFSRRTETKEDGVPDV